MKSLTLALLLSIIVPAGLFVVVLLTDDTSDQFQTENISELIIETPRYATHDETQDVLLTVEWGDGKPLMSSGYDGLLQMVFTSNHLETGSPVALVAGRTLIAYSAPIPFYRPLVRNSNGLDVLHLEELLVKLGYLDTNRGSRIVDETIADAVERFNAASGNLRNQVFDPSTVLWIGPEPLTIDSWHLVPGTPFPDIGEIIARGPKPLTNAKILTQQGQEIVFQSTATRTLDLGSLSVSLPNGILGPESFQSLETFLETSNTEFEAKVRLSSPIETAVVPAGAVLLGDDGSTCVLLPSLKTLTVDLLDSEPGRVYLDLSGHFGRFPTEIVTNPQVATEVVRCD